MKKIYYVVLLFMLIGASAHAQINIGRALKAGAKTVQAVTLTDAQIEQYVKEFIVQSDKLNPICPDDDPYAIRIEKIASEFNNKDGINIKVYRVVDVNAFACADGSVRVFAGLMDIMSDEEILGVIGHEIGHIRNKDTKNAFRTALLNSALREGISSTGGKAAKLSDSQLGSVAEALVNSSYSQKQEYAADTYGYDFLKSCGINPWAMALSFEKLQEMEQSMGDQTGAIQQLFSTHPDIAVRTKKMAERATSEGFARPE